jgi:phenylalanyl-tRNA synthetase beta chain
MLVSRDWLTEYVALDMSTDELTDRLAMSGLNHEGTETIDGDASIDLEVTSNRPDCLGHVGVAREIAVLWERELKIPDAQPATVSDATADQVKVTLSCPDLCPRYTARLVRGVQVGPSPDWIVSRLKAAGIESVNNVVDVTNYVMLECGQPLHAFDFAKLDGGEIVIRNAKKSEVLEAIDHRSYTLDESMCVIADASQPVAVAGVMGGAATEIADNTSDVLIEVAEFQQLAVRTTARKLKLHSPSSYRFERGTDSHNVDWASRRCAELIMQLAGGELLEGVVDVGREPQAMPHVELRIQQIDRLIGISIPSDDIARILGGLGCSIVTSSESAITVEVPSWRRDLTREVDLIEEVVRIHGYDKIPEDAAVPMSPSAKRDKDRVVGTVRNVLTSAGFFEVIAPSAISDAHAKVVSPWTDNEPLRAETGMLKGVHSLRRTLVPSLLQVRSYNERHASEHVAVFETAHIYLPQGDDLPLEQSTVGMLGEGSFERLKGIVESIVGLLHIPTEIRVESYSDPFFEGDKAAKLYLADELLGFIGVVDAKAAKALEVRSSVAVAELDLELLQSNAVLIPQHVTHSAQPSITQDVNVIVDEAVTWADLRDATSNAAGEVLESVEYRETYRNAEQDGDGKKRVLFTMKMQAKDRTLTMNEANEVRNRAVAQLEADLGGKLVQ